MYTKFHMWLIFSFKIIEKVYVILDHPSYYLCSENKGADQLRGYREADLRLCFRICKKPVFSQRGSYSLNYFYHVLYLFRCAYEICNKYESVELGLVVHN